jgi:hypothetical protein
VWEAFLDCEPEPYRLAAGEEAIAECLAAFSLLADVASVYTLGHSSRVADLAERIVLLLGGSVRQSRLAHMAGLAHDLGRVGVLPARCPAARITNMRHLATVRPSSVVPAWCERVSVDLDEVVTIDEYQFVVIPASLGGGRTVFSCRKSPANPA